MGWAAADILSNIAWSNFCLRRAAPITLGSMIKDVVRNKYREPTQQAEKALEIMIKELGSDNTRVLGTKITLAALIQENAREESSERKKAKLHEKAEALKTEIVEVSSALLGEFNPVTATVMQNLAHTYTDVGKNVEAEQLLKRALKVKTALLGPSHCQVANCRISLARLYKNNLALYDKAEEHYMIVTKIRKSESLYDGIIDLYEKTGNRSKVEEYTEEKMRLEKMLKGRKEKKEAATKDDEEDMMTKDVMQMIKSFQGLFDKSKS